MKVMVKPIAVAATLGFFLLCAGLSSAADYIGHRLLDQRLEITTDESILAITAYSGDAFEVHYTADGVKQLPSFAIGGRPQQVAVTLKEAADQIEFGTGALTAVIQKSPLQIAYFKNGVELLAEEKGFFAHETLRGFRFSLQENEKLIGAGERVLGMDRRGYRLPLYNRAHYGYETESKQMYFGMPVVLSSNRYMLVFDNSASGFIDLGETEEDILQFEAVAGRTAYLVIAGDSYPEIINNYVEVTGKQPLPPRWAFGNFASRFGYRTEQETRNVVKLFREQDIPLDAVVLDLYWFGPDIKGHMGNLAWDSKAFPNPTEMMAEFNQQGVKTVLITEPFILSSSDRWQEAVEKNVLARDLAGKPKRYDFYFGNTGLIDVFDEQAGDWFWDIYQGLVEQGVEGLWGDLGEPEVHPGDILHALGTGDELHNAYGHQWAKLVYENHRRSFPQKRPFIMMRSGFPGSQRYGMIPWTGDVQRSWGGLQSQVELSLQMGLTGMGYIHSDLGGFAEGETFDAELYLRWLQMGVFQPVFRPHAQEHIPSEPVFHDTVTRNASRELIKLRYRLLPYIYTTAWQNATTGLPFVRPLFYSGEFDKDLFGEKGSYLFGDAFLVSPVVERATVKQRVTLPRGIWFSFWDDKRYRGGRVVKMPVSAENIPVLVKAGAFVPMTEAIATTRDYSSQKLAVHYYADRSVKNATGFMYEDDGETPDAYKLGQYELLHFDAQHKRRSLDITFSREPGGSAEEASARQITLVVHNWKFKTKTVSVAGQPMEIGGEHAYNTGRVNAWLDKGTNQLHIRFDWSGENLVVDVN